MIDGSFEKNDISVHIICSLFMNIFQLHFHKTIFIDNDKWKNIWNFFLYDNFYYDYILIANAISYMRCNLFKNAMRVYLSCI